MSAAAGTESPDMLDELADHLPDSLWYPSPLWARTRAEALAALLCVTERQLRALISEAREQGVAICATPETGYYIATEPDEIERCCAFLRSRAMHSLRLEAQLRRIPLPDLIGQLHLPT